MWSYVMAAARGDPRRRPGSVFTVQSVSSGTGPGPCRDGLSANPSKYTANSLAGYTRVIPKDHFAREFSRNQLTTSNSTLSRDGSRDVLAEVQIHTPLSERCQTPAEKSPQDNSQQNRLLSTVRNRLGQIASTLQAAIRFRRFSRKESNATPDWFVDKSHLDENAAGDKDDEKGPTCYGHRIVVDPTKLSHYVWLMVVSLAVLYNVIFVLGRAVFWELNNKAEITPLWWTLDYLCDAIYIIDALVHAHEGYLEQGLLVTDPQKLRAHYLQSKSWRTDILCVLPTDLAYIWWPPFECDLTVPCPVIVRLNRLFKLPRLWEWFERTETDTNYPNVFRICKVVLAILVLIHWNACLYFAISYFIGFGSDNWVYNLNGTQNASLTRQYIYSFYWSTLTLTTIGETPVPENDAEYLFVVADFLAGVLIFATIVGNIGSMISNMNVARVDFQNRMDGVKQYMAFRKVGRELEARVIRWFAYTWAESGALDEERVLSALPDKLKAEIAIRVHLDTLRKVRIFQDCEPGLLEALVLKLRLQVFSPGDYICRKGDVGKEMYIVKRGRLQVVADDGYTVLATLGAGSVFGEVSVLDIVGNRTGNRRTANVRSLGYSDLFCLAKDDLLVALADYPEARATLTERGCQLLRKDGLLDEDQFRNAKDTQESMSDSIKKLESTVETLQIRLARLLAEFTASQAKIKQRLTKVETKSEKEKETAASEPPSSEALPVPQGRKRLRSFEVRREPTALSSRHKTM
ncbi:cyclic nucleotide-gated cation channel subunit A isoform X3 [Diabrotica virgifera virgifera]|uniref:Cyclic nucleotide-binding domain-containing protein n=1 Tax=Diabrotica virgifera virgifera TaxID=50390 RepID=A0ABM5K8P7_DIAVI|nr:cyclic nucleotide-gated cation channel subunit A isoform X3 [Diabrotica virgifera virgifera]